MTRFKIRGGRLLLVRGPYENEEVIRAMGLQQAIQWACQLLESIDLLAVTTGTQIVAEPPQPQPEQLTLPEVT